MTPQPHTLFLFKAIAAGSKGGIFFLPLSQPCLKLVLLQECCIPAECWCTAQISLSGLALILCHRGDAQFWWKLLSKPSWWLFYPLPGDSHRSTRWCVSFWLSLLCILHFYTLLKLAYLLRKKTQRTNYQCLGNWALQWRGTLTQVTEYKTVQKISHESTTEWVLLDSLRSVGSHVIQGSA